jgi:ATP-dependent Clp protease protease subunit
MRFKNRSPFRRSSSGLVIENGADEANIMVYDEIGFFGVSAREFVPQLKDISARTIHLHVNSPGGDVMDGLAIANALREHSARVVTHIDALAASIASVIALAGDYVRMADNAFLMIHNPYMLAIGNATELRKGADLLDKIGGSIVNEYVKKSGASADEMKTLMDAETWFTAAEAKAQGLIDAIDNESDEPTNMYDLSIYTKAPAALLAREPDEPTLRELEQAVRDAGLSRSQARQLVAAGMQSIRPPRDAGEDDAEVRAALERLARTMQH